jgi:hypothetical protein
VKQAEQFFGMLRERYAMFERRRSGQPKPWTEDKILSAWRFCNVFREDDRTTVWFKENIREPLRNHPKVIFATVAFRWFNRIETGEKIKDLLLNGNWDSNEVRQRLWLDEPVVTGAYMIKTPEGRDKLDGVLWCIDKFAQNQQAHGPLGPVGSIEACWKMLKRHLYLGGFMAYEVASDLRHTYILENASDIDSWANAGPGCARGLGYIVHGDEGYYNPSSENDQKEMLDRMRDLLEMSRSPENWPSQWPRFEMREIEHGCCEWAKYVHAREGKRLKRKYV